MSSWSWSLPKCQAKCLGNRKLSRNFSGSPVRSHSYLLRNITKTRKAQLRAPNSNFQVLALVLAWASALLAAIGARQEPQGKPIKIAEPTTQHAAAAVIVPLSIPVPALLPQSEFVPFPTACGRCQSPESWVWFSPVFTSENSKFPDLFEITVFGNSRGLYNPSFSFYFSRILCKLYFVFPILRLSVFQYTENKKLF